MDNLQAGRVAGTAAGVITLLAAFLIPFGSIPGFVQQGSTLYSAFSSATLSLPQVPKEQSMLAAEATIVTIVAGILIIVAGVLGAFPLGSGVLGISGMTLLTAFAFIADKMSLSSLLSFGTGYYLILVASIAAVAISLAGRRGRMPAGTVPVEDREPESA